MIADCEIGCSLLSVGFLILYYFLRKKIFSLCIPYVRYFDICRPPKGLQFICCLVRMSVCVVDFSCLFVVCLFVCSVSLFVVGDICDYPWMVVAVEVVTRYFNGPSRREAEAAEVLLDGSVML